MKTKLQLKHYLDDPTVETTLGLFSNNKTFRAAKLVLVVNVLTKEMFFRISVMTRTTTKLHNFDNIEDAIKLYNSI